MVRANRPLAVLATVAMIFLLHYAAEFFIPLFVSLLIAYALARPVTWLQVLLRWRSIAAAVVVLSIVGFAGAAAWVWSDDAQNIYEQLPGAAKTISKSLQKYVKPGGPITEVKKSAVELENVAQTGKVGSPAAQAQPAQPNSASQISLWQVLGTGAKGLTSATADVMVVLFLVFFMLASGDLFKKKLLAIAAERNKKRFTAQVLDDVDDQIRSYLLVMLIANSLVGLGTGLSFWALGVKYPAFWGVVAAVLHTAPYFGPALVAAGSLVASFVQFGSWAHAFGVSGASIAIATVVGMLFSTWLASRQTRMNTTATFIGLLFFGWLWGFWGILLAIPMLSVAKVICEANEDWKPVAELLGR
ncbi:MAG TPA: AI-2E family transporter [Usitatibacter sp.]|jgi:predicted PurR-regulated permease PerM|nr:AI-2E family transporter [Usitatibacter sp.]